MLVTFRMSKSKDKKALTKRLEGPRDAPYQLKSHWVTPVEFQQDLWRIKTRFSGLA